MSVSKIIILPGNGCTPIKRCNWYHSVAKALEKEGFNVVLRDMPDPYVARESIWLPFIEKQLLCDEQTVLIGHSSGAEAAMRYLETHKVLGCVLVSPCVTDLGDEHEAASGYYNRPWQWEKIKQNASWILQFSSKDDHLVPIAEQQEVADNLKPKLFLFEEYGHFMEEEFPELVKAVAQQLGK